MKKKYIVLLSILAVIVILAAGGIIAVSSYISGFSDKVAALSISNVDLKNVADGTYKGSYDLFPVSVVVNVTVKENSITDIELVKHANGQGSAAEVLPDKVIAAQSLNVDTVTGATISSKVILKAIEVALVNAVK